jgi:hypothetical protein
MFGYAFHRLHSGVPCRLDVFPPLLFLCPMDTPAHVHDLPRASAKEPSKLSSSQTGRSATLLNSSMLMVVGPSLLTYQMRLSWSWQCSAVTRRKGLALRGSWALIRPVITVLLSIQHT